MTASPPINHAGVSALIVTLIPAFGTGVAFCILFCILRKRNPNVCVQPATSA